MSQLTFEQYESHARSTSYFLEEPSVDGQRDIVLFGFREEVNELLTDTVLSAELKDMLWGREINPDSKAKLDTSKTAEAGDVLYYVSAAGFLHDVSLSEVGAMAIEYYSGERASTTTLSLTDLDEVTQESMQPRVDPDYNPDYFGMQFWGVSPFVLDRATPGQFNESGEAVHGPLTLKADGLYVLERLARNYSEFATTYDVHFRSEYMQETALLLGGLSAVLQNRFNSCLAEVAALNIQKRERRAAANVLRAGDDIERSRQPDQERPKITGWQSTQLNLFYGLPADNI